MIDLTKYNFNDEDFEFIDMIKGDIELGNEIYLQYNGASFVIESCINKLNVYAYGEDLGTFDDFDDLFLNFKIDGVPMIELIKDIDFA